MFNTLKLKNCIKSNRMSTNIYLCFIILFLVQISNASPIITEEILIDNHNGSLEKIIDTSINLSDKLNNLKYDDDLLIEDFAKLNDKESRELEQDINDQVNEDKTFYIVKASPVNKRPNNKQSKLNSSGRQKKIFKADKNLQRLEKKSWKIPIKSLALYSENTKDSQAPQKMMDELTDLFDSFKDA